MFFPYPTLSETVRLALIEDIGHGDITTQYALGNAQVQAIGTFLAKQNGVLSGIPVALEVLRQVDSRLECTSHLEDGAILQPGTEIMVVKGKASSLLTAERVALNFLQRLSGIATKTAHFVALVEGTKARIVDTRKTTPNLRALEKYAVRCGGGRNHRFGLYDAVMIKDNHIAVAGGLRQAVEQVFESVPHTMSITVECDSLAQVEEALEVGVDIILLDNMTPEQLVEAVELIAGQANTEASGGVNEETVKEIAQSGVDFISVGALTHSAPALDISLNLTVVE